MALLMDAEQSPGCKGGARVQARSRSNPATHLPTFPCQALAAWTSWRAGEALLALYSNSLELSWYYQIA